MDPMEYLFDLVHLDDARRFYDAFGFCAIRDAVSVEDVRAVVHDAEQLLGNGVSIDDPSTYDVAERSSIGFNAHGVIGKEALFTPALLRVRFAPGVLASYSAIYGEEAGTLLPCHDRMSWMRPTIGRRGVDLSVFSTPFKAPGLHLDVSPKSYFGDNSCQKRVDAFLNALTYSNRSDFFSENNAKHVSMGRQVQGVVNLFDNNEEDGGFHCVPGGHLALKQWFEEAGDRFPNDANGRYDFDFNRSEDARLCAYSIRVCGPPGMLILFDTTLPHGTKPNRSPNNRMIQFLRYIPERSLPSEARKNRSAALHRIYRELDFNPPF